MPLGRKAGVEVKKVEGEKIYEVAGQSFRSWAGVSVCNRVRDQIGDKMSPAGRYPLVFFLTIAGLLQPCATALLFFYF